MSKISLQQQITFQAKELAGAEECLRTTQAEKLDGEAEQQSDVDTMKAILATLVGTQCANG